MRLCKTVRFPQVQSFGLFDESCQLTRSKSQVSAAREFRDGLPINFIEIYADRDPPSWSQVRRHKEGLGIISDQTPLLAEARLAGEAYYAVAMMVIKIVGKNPFANAKGEVLIPNSFDVYLGKLRADFLEPGSTRERGR